MSVGAVVLLRPNVHGIASLTLGPHEYLILDKELFGLQDYPGHFPLVSHLTSVRKLLPYQNHSQLSSLAFCVSVFRGRTLWVQMHLAAVAGRIKQEPERRAEA